MTTPFPPPVAASRPASLPGPVLRLRGVTRYYGRRAVLRDVDLDVTAGETVALMGPNGAGKTTLLRIAATLGRPTAGSVTVAGVDARRDAHTARAHLAFVAQDTPVYAELSPAEHIHWWTCLAGTAVDPLPWLREAGLLGHAHRPAGTLSRGQRQRLGIAMAFARDPDLLLLDEPTQALDAAGQDWLARLLSARRGRAATLLVLHDAGQAKAWSDRIVHLRDGRVHDDADDTPDASGGAA